MKMLNKIKIAVIGIIGMLFLSFAQEAEAKNRGGVSFQLFYDQLSPYGEWVNDYEHGYIWLPDAGPNFMPYQTNGYWVMTEYGNTWVSNYSWGWAPFHYGRWINTDYYGWAWIPDYEWGPAWVSWRHGNGHYGWAPLGPRMGIHVHIGIPSHHWVFVPNRYLLSHRIHRHFIPRRNHVRIYNRTTIINNTYVYNNKTYITGPSRGELERVTRQRVNVRQINNVDRPTRSSVDSRTVNLYRPSIDQTTRTAARPTRVSDADAVRTSRSAATQPATSATRESARSSNSTVQSRSATQSRTATQPATSATRESARSSNSTVQPRSATQSRTATQSQSRTATQTRAAQPATNATQSRTATQTRSATQSQSRTATQPRSTSRNTSTVQPRSSTQTRATNGTRSTTQSRETSGNTRSTRN